MKELSYNTYFVKGGRIPILSLNAIGEKSGAIITHNQMIKWEYIINSFLIWLGFIMEWERISSYFIIPWFHEHIY